METPNENEKRTNRWLVGILRIIAGVTAAGVIFGAALFLRIRALSNRYASMENAQTQVSVDSQAQIDRFITSVLIAIQNDTLGSTGARADMVFIVSFNALEQRLSVISLQSDMLLQLDGYGESSLAEAYALGGPGLLVNAINGNFGLDLQSYVCTDTHTLAMLIDLLGGIPAELTEEEASYINRALSPGDGAVAAGATVLNGMQSMAHALNGVSGEAAFGSAARQLALVDSALKNLRKTATRDVMIPLLATAFSRFYTNLDFLSLRNIGYEILKADEMEYDSLILPGAGSWRYVERDGERLLEAELDANAELLHERLYQAR